MPKSVSLPSAVSAAPALRSGCAGLLTCAVMLTGLVVAAPASSAASSASAPASASSPTAVRADAAENSERYNDYVEAHNHLLDWFYGSTQGMEDLLAQYRRQRLGSRSGGRSEPTLYLNVSRLGNHVRALEQGVAQAPRSGADALDQLAARMLGNSRSLLNVGRELEDYVVSRRYVEDGFARGRELDAPLIKGWEQLIADQAALSAALSESERRNRLQAIEAARKRGDEAGALTDEAMLHASDLLELLQRPEDLSDKTKVARADVLLAALERALQGLRQHTRDSQAGSDRGNRYLQSLIADRLTQVVGSYRALKSAWRPGEREFKDMFDAYNRAVRHFDRLR